MTYRPRYNTYEDAIDDGWIRHDEISRLGLRAVDVSGVNAFGYAYMAYLGHQPVAYSRSVWLSHEKNTGGSVGASAEMFRESDLDARRCAFCGQSLIPARYWTSEEFTQWSLDGFPADSDPHWTAEEWDAVMASHALDCEWATNKDQQRLRRGTERQ